MKLVTCFGKKRYDVTLHKWIILMYAVRIITYNLCFRL